MSAKSTTNVYGSFADFLASSSGQALAAAVSARDVVVLSASDLQNSGTVTPKTASTPKPF